MKKVNREVQKSVYSIMDGTGKERVVVAINMSDAFRQCEPDMGNHLYGKALDITVEDHYKQIAAYEKAHKTTVALAIIISALFVASAVFSIVMMTK